jgi:DNA-binding LacI/PurR family transcriptional regulator
MSYRIQYSITGGVLMATISGSCPTPAVLAREIGRQARENSASYLLVDVRGLRDRVGRLRELLLSRSIPARIAVVDSASNERLYTFAEHDARSRGCILRRFEDPDSALKWLWGSRSPGR